MEKQARRTLGRRDQLARMQECKIVRKMVMKMVMKMVTEIVTKTVRKAVRKKVRMRARDSATIDQYFYTGVLS